LVANFGAIDNGIIFYHLLPQYSTFHLLLHPIP